MRDLTRRDALVALAAGAALAAVAPRAATARARDSPGALPLPALFADIEERTFRYFWETTDPVTGLAPDRWPAAAPFASIAATGFALTAYPIGVTRGWITREAARARTLATLQFLWSAPQGEGRDDIAGYKGFFYHFLDLHTGARIGNCELSSVDTTLLLGGILFAAQWFDQGHPDERRLRELAQQIYARVDWRWMSPRAPLIAQGWRAESGFLASDWQGYNEAMLVYLLALAAPEHPVEPAAWTAWCATYGRNWRGTGSARQLAFGPQFGHQYSHVWVDFRGIRDAAMRAADLDYFENSRRATAAQRAYAVANPLRWDGYGADIWGLSACDGPGDVSLQTADGISRRFRGYSARGPASLPDGFDDGTIAPNAAVASLPFAPELVIPATQALHRRFGARLYGRYGFLDAFNPSFRRLDVPLSNGRVDPTSGWVADQYLGIDQGPILAMIANARDGLVWRTMRTSAVVRTGLARADFRGGWLAVQ